MWLTIALPATYVNSMIRYLEGKLAIELRTKLVDHLYGLYMKNETYYKVENLDSRLKNADQGLTEDASRFCYNLAHLHSQLSKPLLDIILMTVQLILLAKNTANRNSNESKGNDSVFFAFYLAAAVMNLTATLMRASKKKKKKKYSNSFSSFWKNGFRTSKIRGRTQSSTFKSDHKLGGNSILWRTQSRVGFLEEKLFEPHQASQLYFEIQNCLYNVGGIYNEVFVVCYWFVDDCYSFFCRQFFTIHRVFQSEN